MSVDVIVVGAGVIGLSSAYQLAQRGLKVVLLEQSAVGQNLNGGSHGESRIIRLIHSDPTYLPLAKNSYRQWRRLEHRVGVKLFQNNGVLWLGDKQGTIERSAILNNFDAPNEILTNKEIAKRYPHLQYDQKWFGVLDHTAGTIYARKSTEALKLKVKVYYNCTVTGWKSSDNQVVISTNNLTFHSTSVVFAVGGWLNSIVPELAVKVRPSLVGVFFWDIEKEGLGHFDPSYKSPNLIISDVFKNQELFLIPEADFKGKVKFGVHLAQEFDILHGLKPVSFVEKCGEIAKGHLKEHFRFLKSEPSVETTCIYAVGSFNVDYHPKHNNVILASGFSGTGFKFGPVIGEIVADLVEHKTSQFDLTPFSANRVIDSSKAKL